MYRLICVKLMDFYQLKFSPIAKQVVELQTSDANSTLDAFETTNSAFAAFRDSKYGAEEIFAVKKVIDFRFHDVNELLHLVLLAMKAINQ